VATTLEAAYSARVAARDVLVARNGGGVHRLRIRACTTADRRVLVAVWAPILDRGPRTWLDRDWSWEALDTQDPLAFDVDPEWLVLADEVEPDAKGDILGTLMTTGPITPTDASLDVATIGDGSLAWVEYIAIAPSIRPDCPTLDRREIMLKRVGAQLMVAAIKRSRSLGCDGRIGLHAEGDVAKHVYSAWERQELPEAAHPAGGSYPVFFGSADWARDFAERRTVSS
jgi:hypothetical protein